MILVQIATALAIGAYVVLSKDAQPKRPDATPRESFQHPADHFLDSDSRAPADTQTSDCLMPYKIRQKSDQEPCGFTLASYATTYAYPRCAIEPRLDHSSRAP
jgi:hypothetical protein